MRGGRREVAVACRILGHTCSAAPASRPAGGLAGVLNNLSALLVCELGGFGVAADVVGLAPAYGAIARLEKFNAAMGGRQVDIIPCAAWSMAPTGSPFAPPP